VKGKEGREFPAKELRDGDRLSFEVVTHSGRAAGIEFRFKRDVMEVWRAESHLATFSRDIFRGWLAALPPRPLIHGDVILSSDGSLDSAGGVALSLPDLTAWVLSPSVLTKLRNGA
jgi:hypothetical protein